MFVDMQNRQYYRCTIGHQVKLLFPRIGAMSIDTPERVKYFGLRSVRACGICRLRKGRSVTRSSTRHDPREIEAMYVEACADVHTRPLQSRRKRFRERLSRHGFDYKKRCRLTHHAKRCLVHIPMFQPTLFGGLVRWEAMHIYYIQFCAWTLQNLVQCVPKNMYSYVAKVVQACNRTFRDPITGESHPRLRSVLRLKHFTAERRVRAIFYWAHVLGLHADVIVEPCRVHVQCVVAYLQLILIATRGHRSYTSHELDVIFRDVGQQFFIHLEALAQYADAKRVANAQDQYNRDPDNNTRPEPWERSTRFVEWNNYMSTNVTNM